jgi:hypothetical protein
MKINNLPLITYDIETLTNVTTICLFNTETLVEEVFELSNRKDDRNKIYTTFTNTDCYFVGYNNRHFDDIIVNYILSYISYPGLITNLTQSVYRLAMLIIKTNNYEKYREFKYPDFNSIDLLTMLFASKLRVGLKEIAMVMNFDNILEYKFTNDWLTDNEIDELIAYNKNDVRITTELLNRCADKLKLRESLSEQYGINLLSVDDVNIGDKILLEEYCKATWLFKEDVLKLKSPCTSIDLEKVILPKISFTSPILQSVLADMKSQHNINDGIGAYNNEFVFGGMKISIGVGGIHGDSGTEIIIPNNNQLLIEKDVQSLYPSLSIVYDFYPPHLGEQFIQVYANIKKRRVQAKLSGDKVVDAALKLCLNGYSGKLGQESSWLYSPFSVMQIRINGQLLLLMLTEQLYNIGATLKQINTDGILYLIDKDKQELADKICKEWEEFTNLTLETEEFSKFCQLEINDYLAQHTNGKVKEKGFFITSTIIGKSVRPKIIPIALQNYFLHNIPIETTIYQETDITKFLIGQKVGRTWDKVEVNNVEVQHTNRYYASHNGYYIFKTNPDKFQVLIDYPVEICNKIDKDKSIKDYNIDYRYYLKECRKVIERLQPAQLELF